jgi:hypothetical protein
MNDFVNIFEINKRVQIKREELLAYGRGPMVASKKEVSKSVVITPHR